jgi:hypothetical protein
MEHVLMAKVGNATFHGASRTVYEFGVYALDSNFKDNIAVVYVLTATNAKGQHEPLDIGETNDLKTYLQKNHDGEWPRDVAHICVHADSSEASRRSKKSDLLAHYSLKCDPTAVPHPRDSQARPTLRTLQRWLMRSLPGLTMSRKLRTP